MKLIAVGPSDRVCNGAVGLFVSGQRPGATASRDQNGEPLSIWQSCRLLDHDEFFMVSDNAANSFDSRYFGPIDVTDIVDILSTILFALSDFHNWRTVLSTNNTRLHPLVAHMLPKQQCWATASQNYRLNLLI